MEEENTRSLCCCTCRRFVEEWRLSLFGVEDYNGQILDIKRTFAPHPWIAVAFVRFLFAGLTMATIVANFFVVDYPPEFFFAWFTNLSTIPALAYLVASFVATVQLGCRRQNTRPGDFPSSVRFAWGLFSLSVPAQLLATVLFWTIVYTPSRDLGYLDLFKHGILAAILMFDGLVVSYIPVRFHHFWFPLLFGTLYMVWNVIHSFTGIGNPSKHDNDPETDDDAIYNALNWNKRPGTAVFWGVVSYLILFPLLFFLTWVLSSTGGGCRFDGSNRRYVTDIFAQGDETEDEDAEYGGKKAVVE